MTTAFTNTRAALDATGSSAVDIESVAVRSPTDAAAIVFAGSPTILIGGEDTFPTDGRTTELSCRVYATKAGLRGAPASEDIEAVLRARMN